MISVVNYSIPLLPANVELVFEETKGFINFEELNIVNISTFIFGEEKVE